MGVGNTKEAIKKINLNWNEKKNLSLYSVTVLGQFVIWYHVRVSNVQPSYRMVPKMC